MRKKTDSTKVDGSIFSNEQNHQFSIVLWGPPGSGKTWFLDAFVTWLWNYTQGDDKPARFRFLTMHGLEMPRRIPARDLTESANQDESAKDMVGYLTRLNLPNQPNKIAAASLSNHTHWLHISDERGYATIELLNDTWKVRPTELSFGRADGVIIAIDLSTLRRNGETKKTGPVRRSSRPVSYFTDQQYNSWIQLLLEKLCKDPARPAERFIAICFMKADSTSSALDDPWALMETSLGKEILEILDPYRKRSDIHIEAFACSSVGYLESPEKKPNISRGELSDLESWAPWNVAAPIFWMLEKVESQHLPCIGNGLCRFFFKKSRLELYIPYPKSPEA